VSSGGSGGQPIQVPVITDCAMVEGATVSELNGHCYRVNFENLDFAMARDACAAEGGHLVTISSKEENEHVHSLHDAEHWIGATDGRADMTPGAGPYQWVTSEPWTYSQWADGQPNAYETDCPSQNDEEDCFEHCAYQSDGGSWIDRPCWHTVVSICEWDIEPSHGAGGAGGAAGGLGAAGAEPE
jgi:Lectin C-type domain